MQQLQCDLLTVCEVRGIFIFTHFTHGVNVSCLVEKPETVLKMFFKMFAAKIPIQELKSCICLDRCPLGSILVSEGP